MEWQPIETAPKDVMILGYIDTDLKVVTIEWWRHAAEIGWYCYAPSDDNGRAEWRKVEPTHWAPLREPKKG